MVLILHWRDYAEHIGYVADLCECCGALRACELWELKQDAGLYGITTERGGSRGFRLRCTTCGFTAVADRRRYRGLHTTARSLDVLVADTHPESPKRLNLEERARNGQATPEERATLIRLALTVVSREIKSQDDDIHVSAPKDPLILPISLAAVACAAGILLALTSFLADPRFAMVRPRTQAVAAAVGILAGVLCFLLARGHGRRIARHTGALGWLALSLDRLQPTDLELRNAFAAARRDAWVARYATPEDVLGEIAKRHRPAA